VPNVAVLMDAGVACVELIILVLHRARVSSVLSCLTSYLG
jgi:hypothetical protein